jgi:PAS domain S-box-containing protein
MSTTPPFPRQQRDLLRYVKQASQIASLLAIAIGCVVLIGWLFGIPTLESVRPGLASMKVNSALACLLTGAAILLWQDEEASPPRRRFAQGCALVVLLIGALTLAEYLVGRDLGIDQLLVQDTGAGIASSLPGRMAVTGALGYLLLGGAIWLLNRPRHALLMQLLALGALGIALLSLTGYLYGVASLYAVFAFSSMSLPTTLALFINSVALLLARPDRGFMGIINADTSGGFMARGLLPAALLLPLLLGWLRLKGQQLGFYGPEFGLALFALSNIVVFTLLIWWNVTLLNGMEKKRLRAEARVRKLNRLLSVLSDINQIIVRVRSVDRLFAEACRIAVEKGNFTTAWIGLYDPQSERMQWAAHAGVAVSEAGERTRPSGITFAAIQSGQHVIVNDIERDAGMVAWRESAQRLGFRSLAAFPLKVDGVVRGNFSLYSSEADFFDEEEVKLLDELALDISFAMEFAEEEEQRQKAEGEVKQYATELEALHTHLEHLVTERTNELLRAKARAEAILDNSTDAFVLTSPQGLIEETNRTFGTLFGGHQEAGHLGGEQGSDGGDYIARPLPLLVAAEDRGRLAEMMDAVNADHRSRHDEFRALRADQSVFAVQIGVGYVANDVEGEEGSQGLVGTIHDISAAKQRERELRYHASLQQAVSDAGIATDLSLRIQSWNAGAEALYGWRAEEVLGKPIGEVLQTDFGPRGASDAGQDGRQEVQAAIMAGEKWTGEVTHRRKDSTLVPALSSTVLFYDENGQPVGTVAVNRDISERKKAEAALQRKLDEEVLFQGYLRALHEMTIALGQVEDLDEFYRRTVELGLQRLGFERMGLLLYDAEQSLAVGTYGTDRAGRVVSEAHQRFDPATITGILMRAMQQSERFAFDDLAPLFDNFEPIGEGWNAAAVLWNGEESLGWLAADNGVRHGPPSKALLDILALYSLTIGALLARKRSEIALRESDERFRQIAENIDQVLFVRSGDDQRLLYVNPVYQTLLGEQLWREFAQSFFDGSAAFLANVHPQDQAAVRRHLADPRRIATGLSDFEFRLLAAEGQVRWLRIRTFPIRGSDGAILRRAGVLEDITQRKNYEEALERSLAHEKELSELKSRFVSMASHEFRTPLATILAVTESLTTYRHRMTEEQMDRRFTNIREQVAHLKSIMDDVLQLARIQSGRVEFKPEPLNLDALCRLVVDELKSQFNRRHPVEYRSDPTLPEQNLDKKLMRQIINNLISNAMKYSPEGKPITVTLTQEGNAILMRVQDEGIGIPEADLKHLFEPFHRAANVGTISGTGLGLSIVKESVEVHGGTIAVASQEGVGTTFTVSLPLTPAGAPFKAASGHDGVTNA